jgi:MFS family permease
MSENVIVRPATTSWGAVLGGWLGAVGAAALVAPVVAGILAGRTAVPNDLGLAIPVVIGLMIAYVLGGYISGRMAGYNTSWHGMMTAFFGLLVTLGVLLVAAAADAGLLAASGVRSLADVFPGIQQLDVRTLENSLTFGAVLGFLATIFAGWLGGLLAPDYAVPAVTIPASNVISTGPMVAPAVSAARERRVEHRPRYRVLPAMGRKGGEREDTTVRETEVHELRKD